MGSSSVNIPVKVTMPLGTLDMMEIAPNWNGMGTSRLRRSLVESHSTMEVKQAKNGSRCKLESSDFVDIGFL